MDALAVNGVVRLLKFTLNVLKPKEARTIDVFVDHARRQELALVDLSLTHYIGRLTIAALAGEDVSWPRSEL